ncbi:MAG: ArsR family transcriptional regulator [Crenarchaeota archaeon]|nr:MAG: ArsR family transcriptional regulator [Thermoproteota archaeon]RDJ33640.1 MAG: ArsR family transcriptional regulator [Thermoproteota archaeon]RDJ38200.1 MAG: ArsR family transcriptional regulator [Thermoproteota archaeon]RDJ39309.1 MAG: ArsR family transcriptional regulator [Thermoproteota archaeon]
MGKTYDHQKIIDCIFDPITSQILSELEDGEKNISHLSNQTEISENEIQDRLFYLVETGFVTMTNDGQSISYSADAEKLSKVIEDEQNFDGAIDGLTKMDSYLN